MAAKVISQETFDDVVKENIIEFSMDPEEAKQETIKQFEAQVSIWMLMLNSCLDRAMMFFFNNLHSNEFMTHMLCFVIV